MLRVALLAVTLFVPSIANAQALQQQQPPLEQKLVDGFEGKDFAPEGGLYYRENFEQSAGTVEFQTAVKRTGNGGLKLSVEPYCPTLNDGCSERAEIWEKTALRVPYDQGVWYGFAVKFEEPIPSGDHRYLIAQWKREIDPGADGDFSPFLALRMDLGKLFATVETNYQQPVSTGPDGKPARCGPGEVAAWARPDVNQVRILVATDPNWTTEDSSLFNSCTKAVTVTSHGNALPEPSSGWIDFAIFTKPGPDGTGHIELFANGKPIITVKGHIGHADKGLGENQYFKFGPYRAADTTDWTLYYDDFRRSSRCADVLTDGVCPFP
ncbi:polysaccharide lyase [Sinorhizobium americanum]|uniref:Polysaccharide lyase-like protein n=1 Tax=Sinorhizobium americanum TaxID=194963 RepID=A0A4R2BUE6_9HYPH|nr:polysaccharide lyase [Sinorhizobium americanum]TCN31427.1 polysaccharide lyase-like protein [Sinorhizobium americanum]